ncbi:MBOAT, membrane-bound o-acyltransferase family domain-containing protein [Ditylenchus destructor]|uniref:Lysophospholipid acyltransferase 5 n=1 Tax=Ditylenchus destructor TaxID=166010 RepID=A0AAD4N672_9BILA|nr:MBOAT, membrane-bound o-acyltransferase family domain-containing protein [Ditylenchus destructor]
MGVVATLSGLTSVPEDGLRLILSMLAGYPLAALYRTFLYNKPAVVQHYFIVTIGILLHLFNCGTTLSVALAHICFLGHLLVGYFVAETATYDITWTTPFCILTLRLIGLVMDVYDGQKPKEKLKPDQVSTAIPHPPSLLEIASFSLFFAGTLVGPQFTFSRYRRFINGEFLDNGEVRQSSIMASIKRFVAGVTFAVFHKWGTLWVPDAYFNSPEFFNAPFHWKVIWNTIWFRATMYRYCFAFLITEGAVTLCGLSYNGKDSTGEDKWDGIRDIHIGKFELGSDFQSVIESFNCGTNAFAKNHVFRRLKWLGNKYYSQGITLFYLALWHGYHLGYFLLFAVEFACVVAQEMLYDVIRKTPGATEFFNQSWMKPFNWLFGRIVINTSMAFAFLTFGLVKKEVWIGPLKAMYFWGYIVYFLVLPPIFIALLKALPHKKKPHKHEENDKKKEL